MMLWLFVSIGVLSGLIIGYFIAAYVIARDQNLVHLQADEIVVKKPSDGLVLVAAPPDTVRRMVIQKEPDKNAVEARDFYRVKK